MIVKEIKKNIKEVIDEIYQDFHGRENLGIEVLIEKPREASHGDYSTNVALVLAKKLQKRPIEVAEEITERIKHSDILQNVGVKEVKAAGGGFINFYLSRDFFIDNLKNILKDKNFGRNKNLRNKKIIIEYTDPNPFKEFHIGHLMSNTIGESISRIIEFHGAKVKRANYQGDVGIHVAKAIWGMMKMKEDPSFGSNTVRDLAFAYAYGAKEYESNDAVKKEINEINGKVYSRQDKEINTLYDNGKKWSLEHFNAIYKKLGTRFDYYFFESQVFDFGKKVVQKNITKVFEEGEKGAIVFKGEKRGLHTRVFINSEGIPTYEAKELGLAKEKYKKYKYNQSVVVTANEQSEYFKVVLAAMSEVFPELAAKTKHIGHGMMRLPEGKMSSRTGNVITFEFLLGEVEKMVAEKIKERDFSEKEKKEIAAKVAIGALKYSILKQSIGSDIVYDFEKSISFEGDSGPYLQYSYARAQSVLRKAKNERIKPSFKNVPNEIGQLEKMMHYFLEVVEKAGKEYEPHIISLYLTELAREFNNYYAKNKIVDKNDEFSPYKVALTQAFSTIMKNGLWLLGIQVPERM